MKSPEGSRQWKRSRNSSRGSRRSSTPQSRGEIPPSKEGCEEEEDSLLGKEEEAHREDAAHSQLERSDRPQDQPRSREGRHDLDVYRKRHPNLPKEVERDFDRGYDGVRKYFPDLKCAIPFKRRGHGRGHNKGEKADDLTPDQKCFNRELSKERVVVEHTISRMKKFRIMADEFYTIYRQGIELVLSTRTKLSVMREPERTIVFLIPRRRVCT